MDAQSTLRRTIELSDNDMAQVSVRASSDGTNPFLETAAELVIVDGSETGPNIGSATPFEDPVHSGNPGSRRDHGL